MSDDDGRSAGELVGATEAGALEILAAEASERLAGVCAGWPEERFRRLVLEVARVRLCYGVPRVEYEATRRAWALRALAAHHAAGRGEAGAAALADAAAGAPTEGVTPPPVRLPATPHGFPAVPDRPASAPS